MEKLPKSVLYTFGVSDLGFGLMAGMELYFFSAFLTDYAQFPLKIAGQILLITSLLDIVCALAGAVVLQKATLHFGGKYRSWLLIGPPIVAPLFVLQFVRIGNDLSSACVVVFGFVSSHMLWNVVYAAVASMVGRMSKPPDERTTLPFKQEARTIAALNHPYICQPHEIGPYRREIPLLVISMAEHLSISPLRIWIYTYRYGICVSWSLSGICPKKSRIFRSTVLRLPKRWRHSPIRMGFS